MVEIGAGKSHGKATINGRPWHSKPDQSSCRARRVEDVER